LSSGGANPSKDKIDNLDSTVSGGCFQVTFDDASTPKITELTGTVMTMTTTPLACGDMNGNGNTEILDAIVMLQVTIGSAIPSKRQLTAGDLEPNRRIDVVDLIILMQHRVGRIPVLQCGP
jgi:hypothetical protein